MKLGAFFVTYDRNDILAHSIEQLLRQTRTPDCVLIVDNYGSSETEDIVKGFGDKRVVYERTGENLGSAGGTAYGIDWIYRQGYDLIYCGDDDNPPRTLDTLERLARILLTAPPGVGGAGVVGSTWDWARGELIRFPDEALTGILEVDMIGGSGHLLIRREVVEQIGSYDSDLFFGYPDLDYSLRIRVGGYRLVVDAELMLEYRGRTGRLNLEIQPSALPRRPYSGIWRNYYTTRNYIYMMREKFQRPDLARREALKALGKSLFSWRRGLRYGVSFNLFALRGVVDGYLGRRGRTVLPNPKY